MARKVIHINEDNNTSGKVRGIIDASGEVAGFKDCDYVVINGKTIEVAPIVSYVDLAVSIIRILTKGAVNKIIDGLPIVYSFGLPTMATDGSHIFINPGFVIHLIELNDGDPDGVIFVILHEIYHVLFCHNERYEMYSSGALIHERANIAMDYEVNWAIEHSYPQMLEDLREIMVDRDAADSLSEDDMFTVQEDGTRVRNQWFTGITKKCQGMYDDKYANMIWEEIYEDEALVTPPQDDPDDYSDTVIEIDMDADYENGFKDGMEAAIRDLRAQGLVESMSVKNPLCKYILYEAVNNVKITKTGYDDGYNDGYNRIMEQIEKLRSGGGGLGPAGQTIKEKPLPCPKIVPLFPIPDSDSSPTNNKLNKANIDINSKNDSNKPGENKEEKDGNGGNSQKNTEPGQVPGRGNAQGDQDGSDKEKDGKDGNGGNSQKNTEPGQVPGRGNAQGDQDGPDPDGAPGQDQSSSSSLNSKPIVPNASRQTTKKISATRVGVASGYDGSEATFSDGDHVISKEEGEKLAKEANYKPGGDDYFVKPSNVDKDKELLSKIRSIIGKALMASSASTGTPASGMSIYDKVDDKVLEIYAAIIDWKKELKKCLKGALYHPVDGPWNKKKASSSGIYTRISVREGETAKRILICIDTSGSVMSTQEAFAHFVAEATEIAFSLKAKYVNIIQFSDGVYSDTEFSRLEVKRAVKDIGALPLHVANSGGTSYVPVFRHIQEKYINNRKHVNAVVFLTDFDVYGSTVPSTRDIPYHKRVTWLLIGNPQNANKLPIGKTLCVRENDFNKQLYKFETNENYSYDREMINHRIKHINEGKFGSFKPQAEMLKATEQEPVDINASATVKIHTHPQRFRHELLKTDLPSTVDFAKFDKVIYQDICKWFRSYTNIWHVFGYNEDDNGCECAKANIDNTFNITGNLIIKNEGISEGVWPKNLIINAVEGSLHIVGGRTTALPAGLPLIVKKNVTVTSVKGITDFTGFPEYVGGYLNVTLCSSLKSLNAVPLRCDRFFCDKFTYADYMEYKTVYESRKSTTSAKPLLEAFSSQTLSRIFRQPNNEEARAAIKGINIMWSEIPEKCVISYDGDAGSVSRFLERRREDHGRTYKGWGLCIMCDSLDKIQVMFTGDNQRHLGERSWKGKDGWVYVSNEVYKLLNERSQLILLANSGDEDAQKTCKKLKIPYANKNVNNLAGRKFKSPDNFTMIIFKLIPELCTKNYIVIGTDEIADRHISTIAAAKDGVNNFTYERSEKKRKMLIEQRRKRISGILVQGRNLNPNNPAYKRYFDDYFLTDQKLIKAFASVCNIATFITLCKGMKDTVKTHYSDLRKKLLSLNSAGSISDDLADTCLHILKVSYKTNLLAHANRNIEILKDKVRQQNDERKSNIILRSDVTSDRNILYRRNYYANEISNGLDDKDIIFISDLALSNRFSPAFVKFYTKVIEDFANIEWALYLASKGKEDEACTYMNQYSISKDKERNR